MPQTIQLFRTTTNAAPPAVMPQGQLAVCISTTETKVWLSDGAVNRCILSSDPTDVPLLTQEYLLLSGGTMAGQIVTLPPVAPGDAANKAYVDAAIAGYTVFRGTWAVAANNPQPPAASPGLGDTINGANWIATTAGGGTTTEPCPAGIPGIATGTSIRHGDRLLWVEGPDIWQLIGGGSLDVNQADARYVNITGDSMSGPLVMTGTAQIILPLDPVLPGHAIRLAYLAAQLNDYLPLLGGTMLGPITIPTGQYITIVDPPVQPDDAVNKAYVDAIPFATVTDQLSIIGDGSPTGTLPLTGPLEVAVVDGGTY